MCSSLSCVLKQQCKSERMGARCVDVVLACFCRRSGGDFALDREEVLFSADGRVLDLAPQVTQISILMSTLDFPPRIEHQSLHAYVRLHLQEIDERRRVGIPYFSIAQALSTVGFDSVSVRSLQTAVFRARKGTCKKGANSSLPGRIDKIGVSRPGLSSGPLSPWCERPLGTSTDGGRAAIARRLRELARPPRPGEPDPLD